VESALHAQSCSVSCVPEGQFGLMLIGNPLHNGEPESAARRVCSSAPVEAIEHARPFFFRYAGTAIENLEQHGVPVVTQVIMNARVCSSQFGYSRAMRSIVVIASA
jgi:hypothetical protein